MTVHTFNAYPATTKAIFDCPKCGKSKRTRTFRVECTVNPFNTDAAGVALGSREVFQQSRDNADRQRDEFLCKPLCATCEKALSWKERKALRQERRGEQS